MLQAEAMPGQQHDPSGRTRTILHVDMDAFFASVEQRLHPEYADRPVIVGGVHSQRGVVSSASYEARHYGVVSAMPLAEARRRCPQAVFVPGNMEAYADRARRARGIYQRYTPCMEPLSIDEAFLDVTDSRNLFGSGLEIAGRIRRAIREELGLAASVGVAPNRLLAKMASAWAKPDGLTAIRPEELPAILDPLPVSALWGVGKSTAERLRRMGVRTLAELRRIPLLILENEFGACGRYLHDACRGIDDQPVHPYHIFRPAKSMSHEVTLARDTRDRQVLRLSLLALSEKLGRRLRAQEYKARTIVLKLRFGDFTTLTRNGALRQPTNLDHIIYRRASALLSGLDLGAKKVRLVGVGAGSLLHGPMHAQMSLFDQRTQRLLSVAAAKDAIRARFGDQALTRASLLRFDLRSTGEGQCPPQGQG